MISYQVLNYKFKTEAGASNHASTLGFAAQLEDSKRFMKLERNTQTNRQYLHLATVVHDFTDDVFVLMIETTVFKLEI